MSRAKLNKELKKSLFYLCLIAPFYEPAFFDDCLPIVDAFFLGGKVLVLLYLFYRVTKGQKLSAMFFAFFVLQFYLLIVTIAYSGSIAVVAMQVFNVAAICLIVEKGISENFIAFLKALYFYFGILLVTSLITAIIAPNGLYFLADEFSQTGNSVNSIRFFLGHKNSVILTLLPGFLACALLSYRLSDVKYRNLTWIYIILMTILAIVLDAMNSLFLCIFLAAAYLLARTEKIQRLRSPFLFVPAIVIDLLITNNEIRNWFAGLLSGIGRDATLSGRERIWNAAIENISSTPIFGQGIGDTATELSRFAGFYSAHNMYFSILAYGGIVGLLLLLSCYMIALKSVSGTKAPSSTLLKLVIIALMLFGIFETMGIGCSVVALPLALAFAIGTKEKALR
jgi:O-antigen ligase